MGSKLTGIFYQYQFNEAFPPLPKTWGILQSNNNNKKHEAKTSFSSLKIWIWIPSTIIIMLTVFCVFFFYFLQLLCACTITRIRIRNWIKPTALSFSRLSCLMMTRYHLNQLNGWRHTGIFIYQFHEKFSCFYFEKSKWKTRFNKTLIEIV